MAKAGTITVDVVANVELVVLQCMDAQCIHNLRSRLACNLKHVAISEDGKCADRQEKAE